MEYGWGAIAFTRILWFPIRPSLVILNGTEVFKRTKNPIKKKTIGVSAPPLSWDYFEEKSPFFLQISVWQCSTIVSIWNGIHCARLQLCGSRRNMEALNNFYNSSKCCKFLLPMLFAQQLMIFRLAVPVTSSSIAMALVKIPLFSHRQT